MADGKTRLQISASGLKNVVSYLKTPPNNKDKCFYDNLSGFIDNLLTERTKDNKTGWVEFRGTTKRVSSPTGETDAVIKNQMRLFEGLDEDNLDITEKEEEFEIPLPNFSHMAYFFEQAGIGFGAEETMRLFLSLKSLALESTFVSVRFWGKMFGIKANYYIAECEFRDGEGDETTEEQEEELADDDANNDSDIDEPKEDDGLPKPDWKEPEEIRPEPHHYGTNKSVYFICNKLGEAWTKLPHVAPIDIVTSRKISKLLTGDLNSPINSYPIFHGTEANYLRSLIARISATTQISPVGHFMFDDEGDEEDEEEVRDTYEVNIGFEGIPVRQLKEHCDMNWVHNLKYVLPQGRCTWYNSQKLFNEDFDEDEDEIEDENVTPPETGPQLLSTVGSDKNVCGHSAWSANFASKVVPERSVCVMKSNLWPGAFAFSNGKIFDNMYIGWGKKYSSTCINPEFPPSSMDEYLKSEDTEELEDPSVEQEEEFKMMEEEAHKSADEIENIEEDED